MKLAIIVGHTKSAKGAFSPWLNASEYDWNTDLAHMIMQAPTALERKVFFRDRVGIKGAYKASDEWGANWAVELHFNSSTNQNATGTAMLYFPGSANGKRLAASLFQEVNEVLRLGDWPKGSGGVLTPREASGDAENGLTNLRSGKAPACLVEPFFGSNKNDCAVAAERKKQYASGIVRAVDRMLQLS